MALFLEEKVDLNHFVNDFNKIVDENVYLKGVMFNDPYVKGIYLEGCPGILTMRLNSPNITINTPSSEFDIRYNIYSGEAFIWVENADRAMASLLTTMLKPKTQSWDESSLTFEAEFNKDRVTESLIFLLISRYLC